MAAVAIRNPRQAITVRPAMLLGRYTPGVPPFPIRVDDKDEEKKSQPISRLLTTLCI
jgi:hypothetical protein